MSIKRLDIASINKELRRLEYLIGASGSSSLDTSVASTTMLPRASKFYFFDDFLTATTVTPPWQVAPSGTGASWLNTNAEVNHPGIGQHNTGTTSTGRSSRWLGQSTITMLFGGTTWSLETQVRVNTLSTITERYAYIEGFGDATGSVAQVDGVYFLYDEGGVTNAGANASANWQLITSSNGTKTYTPTSIPVTAGAWTKLRIEVNAAGTSVEFYIDDVLAAPAVITNIPSGGARYTTALSLMLKSIGSTARLIDVDWFRLESGTLVR